MNTEDKDFFEDLIFITREVEDLKERYRRLGAVSDRLIKMMTRDFAADFSSTASRLYALCRATGMPYKRLARFRKQAYEVTTGQREPDPESWGYDLKAVCEAVAYLTGEAIPGELQKLLPEGWRSRNEKTVPAEFVKRMRITVTGWDEEAIYGLEDGDEEEIKVLYRQEDGAFDHIGELLYEGAQLNLLSGYVRDRGGERIAEPKLLVLDPDFLVDITAICQCYKPYGTHALNHLVNKWAPAPRSAALQLGNLANHFLDNCVNDSAPDEQSEDEAFKSALMEHFEASPIEYTTLPDINQNFFEQARKQYHNIREVVKQKFSAGEIDIEKQEVQLEPSFLCEAMGLQGRMDLLVQDGSRIVELKSGKAEEYPKRAPKAEHALQMALYKEILYYNMDIAHDEVQTYLLYSRYPMFFHIRHNNEELRKALALRNEIVALERGLRNGESESIIGNLKEEVLASPEMRSSSFYIKYLRRDLVEMIQNLQNMDPVVHDYFHTFLAFMEREQFLSKIGDDQADSGRGFAEVWNLDTRTKQSNGNILTDLTLEPVYDEKGSVYALVMTMPQYEDGFLPNFRPGDSVLLYERDGEGDSAVNKQIFRCQIEEIGTRILKLRLMFRQRNARVFRTDAHYAVEPGYADSSYAQAYRGLYSLLLAPKDRRDLILGQRKPGVDRSRTLNCSCPTEETREIVRKAKQAEDYFLLVGPPGTGKTSVALKALVREFLSDTPAKNILLMAYTNRAVDEICQMLESLEEAPEYVRIGQELNCEPAYRNRLIKYRIAKAQNRKQIYEALEPVQIFVGTISSMAGRTELFELKRFDVAIVDEASQVLEPQLLPLLCATTSLPHPEWKLDPCAIRKFILIGDHKQLPAVVLQQPARSEVKSETLKAIGLTNCRNSLFERWHAMQKVMHTEDDLVALLHRQGRMHEELSRFVNRAFYQDALDLVPLEHQRGDLPFCYEGEDCWKRLVAEKRMAFIPVTPMTAHDNPKVNAEEAEVVGNITKAVYELYEMENPGKQVGIIVPFRGQIAMVRKALAARNLPGYEQITIDTVERYQGSQRDVIIFCTTIRQRYQVEMLSAPVLTEGQWVDRKLNVAITRARKQFFLVGNPQLLERSENYRALIEYMEISNKS